MYDLEVQTAFSAAHALQIAGVREPLHGHDWHVTAVLRGAALDEDGLLVDFHAIEQDLRRLVAPFHNRTLNDVPPFDRVNPSAEAVARFLAEGLQASLDDGAGLVGRGGRGGRGLRVRSVRVTEAIGCAATYTLD